MYYYSVGIDWGCTHGVTCNKFIIVEENFLKKDEIESPFLVNFIVFMFEKVFLSKWMNLISFNNKHVIAKPNILVEELQVGKKMCYSWFLTRDHGADMLSQFADQGCCSSCNTLLKSI